MPARKIHRSDSNQGSIVDALRLLPGVSVLVLGGTIDLLVGYQGRNYLIDTKGSQYTAIKPSQKKLAAEWKGQLAFAYTLLDVLNVIGYDWIRIEVLGLERLDTNKGPRIS